jgi:hypothetical protein
VRASSDDGRSCRRASRLREQRARQQQHLREENHPPPVHDVPEGAGDQSNNSDGAVLAVCTSATMTAEGDKVAISHAATVACMV